MLLKTAKPFVVISGKLVSNFFAVDVAGYRSLENAGLHSIELIH